MNYLKILPYLFIFIVLGNCNRYSRHVEYFDGTNAYELAKAVEREDLQKIEQLVQQNPDLFKITSHSPSGSNILIMAIYVESFDSFAKLLNLGANPNSKSKYDNYSVLIHACSIFGSASNPYYDNRYAELLLEYGANPNYAVKEDFTNEKGYFVRATSPLMEASVLNLELVKLLIKHGANIDKRVGGSIPLAKAVNFSKFDIIYYYIDSLNVDAKQPLLIRETDSLYIQDFIKQFMGYKPGTDGYKKKQQLKEYLKSRGVNFKNYEYKL